MDMLSEAVEDYIKAIYTLCAGGGSVSTSAIAERLEVAPASVTQMLKKLDGMEPKLVDYRRHHGVTLTKNGERIAIEILRHHRLIELFLQEALGMSWDQVDKEAERLEHVVSEALADRMAAVLGNPKFDPHGDPIPSKGGDIPEDTLCCLSALEAGQAGIVRRVSDEDSEMLRYVASLGIVPNVPVQVLEKGPFDGPIHVRVTGADASKDHALGRKVAQQVFVERTASAPV